LEYLVSYYYYEDINPYDAIDAISYDISAEYTQDGLRLTVSPPVLVDYQQNASY
jgi:hypothetical protein